MNPWKILRDYVATQNKIEEEYYAAALEEFCSGQIRPGLMAKAIAESGGDENKAKAAYIKLLANAIRDDQYLARRMYEEATKAHGRAQEQIREVCEERAKDEGLNQWVSVVALGGFFLLLYILYMASSGPLPVQRPQPPPSSYDRAVSTTKPRSVQSQASSPPKPPDLIGSTDSLLVQSQASSSPKIFTRCATCEVSSVQSQASSPPKRECEYKAVMSDDDYRACNLTPPTVR